MEVERSLFRGATGGDTLKHLTVQGESPLALSLVPETDIAFWGQGLYYTCVSISFLQTASGITWPSLSSKYIYTRLITWLSKYRMLFRIMPGGQDWKSSKDGAREYSPEQQAGSTSPPPPPLPLQVIERNRLTLAEILALPRFGDYSPGEPSKVRLNSC